LITCRNSCEDLQHRVERSGVSVHVTPNSRSPVAQS
jgi:hypothetical protein